MIMIKVKLTRIKPAIIDFVAGYLQKGRIVVLPTDTIYGLSCRADSTRAIRKIYRLKKRDPRKPVLVLVSDMAMVEKYAVISAQQKKILAEIWSKNRVPATVILKKRRQLPAELTRGTDGLAMRLPKSDFLIKIIKKVGRPLVSTSLNLSGRKNIEDLGEIEECFSGSDGYPDLIVDAGQPVRRRPSRLLDIREENRPVVIRR